MSGVNLAVPIPQLPLTAYIVPLGGVGLCEPLLIFGGMLMYSCFIGLVEVQLLLRVGGFSYMPHMEHSTPFYHPALTEIFLLRHTL